MNPDRFLDRTPRRPETGRAKRDRRESGKMSRRQERRVADALGGRRVPGSGSGLAATGGFGAIGRKAGRKGDVEAGPLLVEAKATRRASLSVRFAWVEKIAAEAAAAGRVPALALTFEGRGGGATPRDLVAVPAEWLRAVMRRAGLANPA